jgi:hypothetical protein
MVLIDGRPRLRGTAARQASIDQRCHERMGHCWQLPWRASFSSQPSQRRYTSKTRGPGKRYSDAARFERKKSRLRRVNDRREMKRQWPTRYLQSVSDVPQQWIRSARDTRKPGIEKVNGTMVPSSLSSRCQIHTFLTYTLSFCHPDNVPG